MEVLHNNATGEVLHNNYVGAGWEEGWENACHACGYSNAIGPIVRPRTILIAGAAIVGGLILLKVIKKK